MISNTQPWTKLITEQARLAGISLRQLCKESYRFEEFHKQAPHWLLDFSRQRLDSSAFQALIDLANEARLKDKIESLFRGDKINTTEQRAVRHIELRNPNTTIKGVRETQKRIEQLCHDLFRHKMHSASGAPFKHIINIGIGGSDLGPRFVCEALSHYANKSVRCHFISNIAPSDLSLKLKDLDPDSILFVVSSKSFSTQETLVNAEMAKRWLTHMTGTEKCVEYQFLAVTANPERAAAFGIHPDNIFPMWDWVGGRYSLWSAVGLPIALALGYKKFERLLNGAHEVDEHFRNTPFEDNVPVIMGLLGLWQRNFWHVNNQAIIPYSTYLDQLPKYLQQLDMESNGKSVNHEGVSIPYATGPIVWGGAGTDSQHAFHQLLHQSQEHSMIDFIGFRESLNPTGQQQAMLFAHLVAQADALAQGKTLEEADKNPHRVMPGNKASNLLLSDRLTPESLGALIALYEHKVFVEASLWDINAFDQFGVELGKKLADEYFTALQSSERSSIGAINWFKDE